jgi:hypothetical protein
MIPVTAHLTNPNVTSIYAISFSGVFTGGAEVLPPWLEDLPLLYNVLGVYGDLRQEITRSSISELSIQSAKTAYSFIPNLAIQVRAYLECNNCSIIVNNLSLNSLERWTSILVRSNTT